ncbi:sugar O-acetyltransferase [Nocardioides gilvus]|uniref:sugar O-acetyltransferase n=1 Tax=Nocardioides gilvus TaxID=1735589 RepID=UPI001950526C|nr:sugar O-acetyltransferase [Nocardioides gilvus]
MSSASNPLIPTMRDRMLAGRPYVADGTVATLTDRAQRLAAAYNAADADPAARREKLVEMLGSVGEDVEIRPPFHVDLGTRITVGDRTFANFGLVALDIAQITIGADVQIGPNVQLLTPLHPLDAEQRRGKWESAAPITIGDNVWLGGGVIVCPGVTIGENTVVGAGSVVVSDLEPGILAVGNPAKMIRRL